MKKTVRTHYKTAINALQSAVALQLRSGDISAADRTISALRLLSPTEKEFNDSEKALVRSGNFIEAIKYYRSRTGNSLSEGKDAIDAYRDTLAHEEKLAAGYIK